jgi:hypothetical protein
VALDGRGPALEHHAHRAVAIGAQHLRAPQVLLHDGVGVPVVVVRADADQGGVGTDLTEEALDARVPAVVRHLEHVGAEGLGVSQQALLREDLRIAGEQDGAVRGRDAEHEGVLVEVVTEAPVRRR